MFPKSVTTTLLNEELNTYPCFRVYLSENVTNLRLHLVGNSFQLDIALGTLATGKNCIAASLKVGYSTAMSSKSRSIPTSVFRRTAPSLSAIPKVGCASAEFRTAWLCRGLHHHWLRPRWAAPRHSPSQLGSALGLHHHSSSCEASNSLISLSCTSVGTSS